MTRPPERDEFVKVDPSLLEDAPPPDLGVGAALYDALTAGHRRRAETISAALNDVGDVARSTHEALERLGRAARRREDDRSTTSPHGDPMSKALRVLEARRRAPATLWFPEERHVWDKSKRSLLADLRARFSIGIDLGRSPLTGPPLDMGASPFVPDGMAVVIQHPVTGRELLYRSPPAVPGFSRYALGVRELELDRRRQRRRR